MAYYEFLRVRKSAVILTAIVVALAATIYAIAEFHSASAVIKIQVGRHSLHAMSVVIFTSMAAWMTAILACIISTSLNRLRDHLPYVWTRPESRVATATSLVGIDIAMLAGFFIVVMGVEITCFLLLARGAVGIGWNDAAWSVLRAFGFAVMWYAIVQAVSAGVRVSGTAIAGISWPVFIVGASLEGARFPAPWNQILTAFNIFNPMAYLSGTTMKENGDVVLQSFIGFDPAVRVALMYGIAVLALLIAVTTWKRMEA